MNDMNQFKTMIDTMQRRRIGVEKQIAEFQKLQNEIAGLYARVDSDPVAQKKLQKLEAVINNNGKKLFSPALEKVAALKKNLDQLGRQIKQLAPEHPVTISEKTNPATANMLSLAPVGKKHLRKFV